MGLRARTLLLLLLLCSHAAAAAPAVVASIVPVHALVAGVMAGVGEPHLLMPGGASPHDYSLRPSDARALQQAQVVFWVGPALETVLERPLAAAPDARTVALLEAPELTLWPRREGGVWETDDEAHHDHGTTEHDAPDPHVWLDPDNAVAMVRQIAVVLSEIDPDHAGTYRANAGALMEGIAALDAELGAALAPVRETPFVVFHDAYQYLERHYGLATAGAIAVDPESRPGARRVREIRALIEARGARCLFAEPQFRPALVEVLVADTGVATGMLDPLGAELAPGPGAYFALMRGLAGSLVECLGSVAPGA